MSVTEDGLPVVDDDGFNWGTLDTSAADEAQPEAQEEPEAEQEAATTPGRARDEKGRFVSQEQDGDDPEVQQILAKYGGDVTTALKALDESQRYIGSLHNEQGLLRQQLEQLTQAIQNPRPQQDFEALLEDNPQQAAMVALASGDQQAYLRAKQEWHELSPGAPQLFEQNLMLQRRLEQLEQQIPQIAAPVQQQQQMAVAVSAFQAIPDFDDLREPMREIIGEMAKGGYDWITPALESGNPQAVQTAANTLAELARARTSATTQQQAQQATERFRQQTELDKQQAVVASATSGVSTDAKPSPSDLLWDQWGGLDIGRLKYDS